MKKYFSILMALALILTLFAGCGNPAASAEPSDTVIPQEETTVEETALPSPENKDAIEAQGFAEDSVEETPAVDQNLTEEQRKLLSLIPEGQALTFQSYPLSDDPDAQLTLFFAMHPLLSQYFDSASELPILQTTEEITGVHVEYNSVSFLAADTQVQLMIASGDMNDIMPLAMRYTAGADAAVEEGLLVDLTEYLPVYAANYQGLMDYNETFRNAVTTADGRVVGFSSYSMDNTRIYISGPEVRKDWLDKLGLDAPVTLDDYHDMLTAFKNQLDVETPMWLHYSGINRDNQLTRAFDIDGIAMLLIDGQVTSSLLQPGFKAYLEMMNQWYKEGLFAQDFFSDTSSEEPDLAVVANTYGLFYQYATEYPELKGHASDPDFEILAITDAVQEAGDKLKISNGLDSEASPDGYYNITTACDDVELACQWLDFFYSPDGWLLSNYGTEDVSFTYDEDGVPHWTDVIANSEYPSFVAKSMYTMLQGAYLMHAAREFDVYTEDMIEASDIWASVEADGDYLNLPSYVTLSSEASEAVTPIWADIDTYVDECLVKFIIGDMNLTSDYDAFIETLNKMNIDAVIDAYQQTYERILAQRT